MTAGTTHVCKAFVAHWTAPDGRPERSRRYMVREAAEQLAALANAQALPKAGTQAQVREVMGRDDAQIA